MYLRMDRLSSHAGSSSAGRIRLTLLEEDELETAGEMLNLEEAAKTETQSNDLSILYSAQRVYTVSSSSCDGAEIGSTVVFSSKYRLSEARDR